jgi:hypothetical protein
MSDRGLKIVSAVLVIAALGIFAKAVEYRYEQGWPVIWW